MRKNITIGLIVVIVWFTTGFVGSLVGMHILRYKRCLTMADLATAGFLTVTGPVNLLLTPFATGLDVLSEKYPGCVYPKFGDTKEDR